MRLQLFADIALGMGLVGATLIAYPVIYRMVHDARNAQTRDRLVGWMLVAAKSTYFLMLVPFLVVVLLGLHRLPETGTIIVPVADVYLFIGWVCTLAFLNSVTWMLIYTRVVQEGVQWVKKRMKRDI